MVDVDVADGDTTIALSGDVGRAGVVTGAVEVVASLEVGAIVRLGVTIGDDVVDIESKDDAEDVTAVGIDIGRVLAPASHSFASSFSARRVTSANLAEIASTAVKLLPRIEASSASDILPGQANPSNVY